MSSSRQTQYVTFTDKYRYNDSKRKCFFLHLTDKYFAPFRQVVRRL